MPQQNTQYLPVDFVPGPNDVLIGRGKKCYQHIGNVNFHLLVSSKLNEYKAATTKVEKSVILASVVAKIQEISPNGGFLKQESKTGLWFHAGEFLAREKTSQAFRDALDGGYKSSNSSKKRTRQMKSKVSKVTSSPQTTSSSSSSLKAPDIAKSADNAVASNTVDKFESFDLKVANFDIGDQNSVAVSEIDFNLDFVSEVDGDALDLLSCGSLCEDSCESSNDPSNDFTDFLFDHNLEPSPILDKSNTFDVYHNAKRAKKDQLGAKASFSMGARNTNFSNSSSIPRRRTAAAMSA